MLLCQMSSYLTDKNEYIGLAREKVDQIDSFLATMQQQKNESRDRLARIIDGRETLD